MGLLIMLLGAAAVWFLSEPLLRKFVAAEGEAGLTGSFTEKVGNLVFEKFNRRDGNANTLRALELRLRLAGKRTAPETALAQAQGAGILAGIVGLVMLGLASGGLGIGLVIFCALVGVGVSWMMLARIGNWITDRRRQLNRQFPYFLDLAVMSMDSGTSMLEVIDAYTPSAPGTALAQELSAMNADIRMGSTVEGALIALEARIPSDDIVQVCRSIRQGLRMGTPLAQIFREQADSMRFKRSQAAERSAEELKVKLQGPAMMLVISVLILVLGPAIVGMITGGG
jgi:pilus assembly protein TadC